MGKVVQGKWEKKEGEKSLHTKANNDKEKVYQLKISLMDSNPEIWRRVLVSGNTTLGKLHRIIQHVMDWTDSHLHEFIVKDVSYADPDPEMEMDRSKNENRIRLYEIAPVAKSSFVYVYDFGDGWEHKIKVEKIMDHHERFSGRPVCLEGESACPPEDCGGIYGYYDMLEIIKNPKHPEYNDTMEWLGGEFDPNVFDLDETNQILKKMR
jgi:hypothetical protein